MYARKKKYRCIFIACQSNMMERIVACIPPTLDGWVYIIPIHGPLDEPLYTWAQYTPTLIYFFWSSQIQNYMLYFRLYLSHLMIQCTYLKTQRGNIEICFVKTPRIAQDLYLESAQQRSILCAWQQHRLTSTESLIGDRAVTPKLFFTHVFFQVSEMAIVTDVRGKNHHS